MLTSIRGFVAATLLAGSALAAVPAYADAAAPPSEFTITGTAAVVSQYRFRGLSQSDNRPAVQESLTLSHKSGFYISEWGSSASSVNSPINIGGTEIDIYGGYAHEIASGLKVDVGVYGYVYPGASGGNLYEIYGSLAQTFGPATAKVGVYYAPAQKVFNFNFSSTKRHNTYVYGELSSGIPNTPISLHGHLGYTSGGFEYGKAYLDYTVGASYTWKMLTLDASIVGTDISRTNVNTAFGCANAAGCITFWHRPAKTVGVVALTAAF